MSLILVDGLKDRPGTGGPKFPNGLHLPAGIGITGDGHINMAGVCTFSGNVTIGGTLTYEDVTNIDSVGVVTARSGVNVSGGEFKVGTAVTVGSAGVSTFSGNVNLNGVSSFAGGVGIADSIFHTGDTNTAIRFPAADTVSVETAGSERLRVSSAGNVSIGNNDTPDTLLHIQGDQPKLRIESTNALSTSSGTEEIARIEFEATKSSNRNVAASMRARQDGTWSTVDDWFSPTAIEFFTQDQSGTEITTPRVTITSTGTFGVGTSTPYAYDTTTTVLEVKGAATASDVEVARFRGGSDANDGTAVLRLTNDNDRGLVVKGGREADAEFAEFGTSSFNGTYQRAIRLTNDGKVGVGITNPAEKFEVKSGNIAIVGMPGGGGYKIDTHPLLSYAAFSLNTGNYACRVGSTGSSTVRHTQIYGGGSHIATFDGVKTRLGIGITNPDQKLTLKDAISPTIRTILNDTTVGAGQSFGAWEFESLDSSTGSSGVIGKIDCVASANLDGTAANGSQLRFYTSGTNSISLTEKLRITPTGGAVFNGTKGATGSNSMPFSDGYSALEARAPEGTTQFTVTNTTYEDTTFNNEAGIWFKGNYSGNNERAKSAIIHQNSADYGVGNLVFCVDGAADNGNATIANDEVMRLLQNGDVLIQATSADMNDAANLGFSYQHHATGPYIRIKHAGAGGGYANYTLIHFVGGTSAIGEIKQDGDGTITYATSSDYRLKENIVDLTGAITRVKNLKPKRFNFKLNSGLTKDGFLAHELQEVVPESVNGTKDEVVTADGKANNPTLKDLDVGDPVYQTADASRVVPLLTAALQEAIAKIETLETKVAALESN